MHGRPRKSRSSWLIILACLTRTFGLSSTGSLLPLTTSTHQVILPRQAKQPVALLPHVQVAPAADTLRQFTRLGSRFLAAFLRQELLPPPLLTTAAQTSGIHSSLWLPLIRQSCPSLLRICLGSASSLAGVIPDFGHDKAPRPRRGEGRCLVRTQVLPSAGRHIMGSLSGRTKKDRLTP